MVKYSLEDYLEKEKELTTNARVEEVKEIVDEELFLTGNVARISSGDFAKDFIEKMNNDYEICKLDIQRIGKFITLNYHDFNDELA